MVDDLIPANSSAATLRQPVAQVLGEPGLQPLHPGKTTFPHQAGSVVAALPLRRGALVATDVDPGRVEDVQQLGEDVLHHRHRLVAEVQHLLEHPGPCRHLGALGALTELRVCRQQCPGVARHVDLRDDRNPAPLRVRVQRP